MPKAPPMVYGLTEEGDPYGSPDKAPTPSGRKMVTTIANGPLITKYPGPTPDSVSVNRKQPFRPPRPEQVPIAGDAR